MTQPTTLATSFDTSLVDVQKSFSSTETNTSVSSSTGKENMPPSSDPSNEPGASSKHDTQRPSRQLSPYTSISTSQLYTQWASTYDTDGNILQFVDDQQMPSLLSEFVDLTLERHGSNDDGMNVLDLGCGTGRSTLNLLHVPWPEDKQKDITFHAWDSSPAMLGIAREKFKTQTTRQISTEVADIATPATLPQPDFGTFSGLISTLVLEHLPLSIYFTCLSRLLGPGCHAIVTNMHPDMGRLSQAGFKTEGGERVKGESFVYTIEETVQAAKRAGLEVVGEVREGVVDEGMFEGVKVAERARKWIGVKVWYGMVLRRRWGMEWF